MAGVGVGVGRGGATQASLLWYFHARQNPKHKPCVLCKPTKKLFSQQPLYGDKERARARSAFLLAQCKQIQKGERRYAHLGECVCVASLILRQSHFRTPVQARSVINYFRQTRRTKKCFFFLSHTPFNILDVSDLFLTHKRSNCQISVSKQSSSHEYVSPKKKKKNSQYLLV